MHYHIRVQGHLDLSWQHRFEGLRIEHLDAGTTLLSGSLPDQAALHRVLLQIIRLGLTLLSLQTSEVPPHPKKRQEEGAESGSRFRLERARKEWMGSRSVGTRCKFWNSRGGICPIILVKEYLIHEQMSSETAL